MRYHLRTFYMLIVGAAILAGVWFRLVPLWLQAVLTPIAAYVGYTIFEPAVDE